MRQGVGYYLMDDASRIAFVEKLSREEFTFYEMGKDRELLLKAIIERDYSGPLEIRKGSEIAGMFIGGRALFLDTSKRGKGHRDLDAAISHLQELAEEFGDDDSDGSLEYLSPLQPSPQPNL